MIDQNSRCRRQIFSARSHLAHEGDASQYCYMLLSGTIVRETILIGGRRQIAGLHVPGDICGLSPIPDATAPCNIVALSEVKCLVICRNWLSSVFEERPDIRDAAWRETARDLAISTAWIANIGQRHAFHRIAHFVCELAARWGTVHGDEGTTFEWHGTQADIGAALGLSLVHVNKTLRRLNAERIASVSRRTVIHDAQMLGEIAGFDPDYLAPGGERLSALLASIANTDASRPLENDQRASRSRFDPRPVPFGAMV